MSVPDVIEEVELRAIRKESGGYAVYGCVAPPLVVESAFGLEVVEVRGVRG